MQKPRSTPTQTKRLIASAVNKRQRLSKVAKIRPYDILCGRDKAAFNNVGNRRFRVTINLNLPKYVRAHTKNQKSDMILSLVRFLRHDVGVRFLKKKGKSYFELDEKQARSKVGHALRDMLVAQEEVAKRRSEREAEKDNKTEAEPMPDPAPTVVSAQQRDEAEDEENEKAEEQQSYSDGDNDDDHSFYTPPPLLPVHKAAHPPVALGPLHLPLVPGPSATATAAATEAMFDFLPMPETRAAFFALEELEQRPLDGLFAQHTFNTTAGCNQPSLPSRTRPREEDEHDALVLWDDPLMGTPYAKYAPNQQPLDSLMGHAASQQPRKKQRR